MNMMPKSTFFSPKLYISLHPYPSMSESKTFFTNNYLTITDEYISYRSFDMKKKIYVRNIAGYDFHSARMERMMSFIASLVGILGFYLYTQYNIIYILAGSILFLVGGIVGFILSKDSLTIHSNASTLSMPFKLGRKQHLADVECALDDAVRYSKKK
jgi:hypothetical protein